MDTTVLARADPMGDMIDRSAVITMTRSAAFGGAQHLSLCAWGVH